MSDQHRLVDFSSKSITARVCAQYHGRNCGVCAVLTDSGGVQEETTYLQVPCLTFRATTERPITVEIGTNELLFELNPVLACEKILQVLNGTWKQGKVPDLWDGKAAARIAAVIDKKFSEYASQP